MELQSIVNKSLRSFKCLKLFCRACMSYSSEFNDEEIIKKRKLSVIKKRFYIDQRDSPEILEAKDASTVIKNLNWEFKMLYGAVQYPKSDPPIKNNCKNIDTIIQSQTVFPILDPKDDTKIFQGTDLDTDNDAIKISCWQTLLKFPLQNKQSPALESSDLEINEINSLRKVLEDKSKSYIPSVSKILEKTMPQEQAETLRQWKENMIKKLGEEGFEKYHKEILERGHSLHACVSNYLASVPRSELEIEKSIAGHWESLKPIFSSITDVKLLEERISHPFLRYKGIVDCFARYKNNLVVIDWKTSKKRKNSLLSTYDNPLQVAAYVGALNFDPKYQYLVNKGLIVVAYEDGEKASAHFMDEKSILHYWKAWLARVKLYWELTEKEVNPR